MKRKYLSATFAATLLVLVVASPAYAGDGGLKHINFPNHDCTGAVPTHVDLYVHAWNAIIPKTKIDGRIRYYSGTCAKAASRIHIYTIILWEYYGGTWHNVDSSGSHDLDVSSGYAIWSTPGVICISGEPKSHVEVQYRIDWRDGTSTPTRDDNSYNWTPAPWDCTT